MLTIYVNNDTMMLNFNNWRKKMKNDVITVKHGKSAKWHKLFIFLKNLFYLVNIILVEEFVDDDIFLIDNTEIKFDEEDIFKLDSDTQLKVVEQISNIYDVSQISKTYIKYNLCGAIDYALINVECANPPFSKENAYEVYSAIENAIYDILDNNSISPDLKGTYIRSLSYIIDFIKPIKCNRDSSLIYKDFITKGNLAQTYPRVVIINNMMLEILYENSRIGESDYSQKCLPTYRAIYDNSSVPKGGNINTSWLIGSKNEQDQIDCMFERLCAMMIDNEKGDIKFRLDTVSSLSNLPILPKANDSVFLYHPTRLEKSKSDEPPYIPNYVHLSQSPQLIKSKNFPQIMEALNEYVNNISSPSILESYYLGNIRRRLNLKSSFSTIIPLDKSCNYYFGFPVVINLATQNRRVRDTTGQRINILPSGSDILGYPYSPGDDDLTQ